MVTRYPPSCNEDDEGVENLILNPSKHTPYLTSYSVVSAKDSCITFFGTHQITFNPANKSKESTISLSPIPKENIPPASHNHPISYAEVVKGKSVTGKSVTAAKKSSNRKGLGSDSITLKPTTTYLGKPAVIFSNSDKHSMIQSMKFVLIGKFSHGRPALVSVKLYFANLNLKGFCNISIYDSKHLIFECEAFEDYVKIWMENTCYVEGFLMRIFKWNEDFHPSIESPVCPVWVHLPDLPLFLFHEEALMSLANTIGRPLALDLENINRSKLGCASFCVEVDVSIKVIDKIWIEFKEKGSGVGQQGFWQKVFFDSLPSYCTSCDHLGHSIEHCLRMDRRLGGGLIAGPSVYAPQTSNESLFTETIQTELLQSTSTLDKVDTIPSDVPKKSLDVETEFMVECGNIIYEKVSSPHLFPAVNFTPVIIEDVTLEEGELAVEGVSATAVVGFHVEAPSCSDATAALSDNEALSAAHCMNHAKSVNTIEVCAAAVSAVTVRLQELPGGTPDTAHAAAPHAQPAADSAAVGNCKRRIENILVEEKRHAIERQDGHSTGEVKVIATHVSGVLPSLAAQVDAIVKGKLQLEGMLANQLIKSAGDINKEPAFVDCVVPGEAITSITVESVVVGQFITTAGTDLQQPEHGQSQEHVPCVQAATVGTVTKLVDGTPQPSNQLHEHDQVAGQPAAQQPEPGGSYEIEVGADSWAETKNAGVQAKAKAGNSWADLVEEEKQAKQGHEEALQELNKNSLATLEEEVLVEDITLEEGELVEPNVNATDRLDPGGHSEQQLDWSTIEGFAMEEIEMLMASPTRMDPVFTITVPNLNYEAILDLEGTPVLCSEVIRKSSRIADVRKHFQFLSNEKLVAAMVEEGKYEDFIMDAMKAYTKEIHRSFLEQEKSIYHKDSATEKVTSMTQEAIPKVSTMDEKEWTTPKRRGKNRNRPK